MDICFQCTRFCLTYDLKSQVSFLFCFSFLENTALSSMDHRLKHVILLSLDSERVGGRWALSTGTKKLGLVDLEGNF